MSTDNNWGCGLILLCLVLFAPLILVVSGRQMFPDVYYINYHNELSFYGSGTSQNNTKLYKVEWDRSKNPKEKNNKEIKIVIYFKDGAIGHDQFVSKETMKRMGGTDKYDLNIITLIKENLVVKCCYEKDWLSKVIVSGSKSKRKKDIVFIDGIKISLPTSLEELREKFA